MLEAEFRNWLEARGAKSPAALNSRVHAVKTIERNLAQLGSPHADLAAAFAADGFAQLREQIKQIRSSVKNGNEDYRILMPDSENPMNRLASWNSWLAQYGHFLAGSNSQADEIREYVLEHYIGPARERGDDSVSVVVGTLNNEMGLSKAWPNICQTLEGRKFQELADVLPPSVEGPQHSTTRKLTFMLTEEDGHMAQLTPTPNNLIFYGPPGTGKTYHTALKAVELCDGEADYPASAEGRAALMKRYNALMAAKRISFVTFHGNYDYETFVEGLRPETGEDEAPSSGFRLEPTPGVFREICALAEQARTRSESPGETSSHDLTGRRFWKMALGQKGAEDDVYEGALAGSYIALGYGQEIDWSPVEFSSIASIKQKFTEVYPEIKIRSNWTQIHQFRNEMKVGDIVIVSSGNKAFRAIGVVGGEYYFDATVAGRYAHRRPVDWLLILDEPLTLDIIFTGNFVQRALYRLSNTNVNVAALNGLVGQTNEQPDQFVLIIDEINRANISKVFGELITLLEPDKRLGMPNALTVTLPYSKKRDFGVPANLHIVGTMNTADRSIALLDTALRRRFTFRELPPAPGLLGVVDGVDLKAVLTTINRRIEYLIDREHRIGHAFFIHCETREQIEEVMRDKVIPLLQEYFFEDWSRIASVLGDGFLLKEVLHAPPGITGDPVFSWSVRSEFEEGAFLDLISNTKASSDSIYTPDGEPAE
ncbi:AAA family ATPase [Pokkaliibacter plantistimulans]|uniref:AAA family ATPase n=1 Tax=Proteobacteria bacterium 228 TaxID=2083153 RepID=A0A2S5KUP3_9PROT|nr:AAA family ATPase [Pokkaliibacter plantistimulans]PPC78577.1 AAA family ATPase [Pokkaliibacter plantistimulans]